MKTIEVVIESLDQLQPGDQIIRHDTGPGRFGFMVEREVPTQMTNPGGHWAAAKRTAEAIAADAYSSHTIETAADILARMFLSLDEHLQAGGSIPLDSEPEPEPESDAEVVDPDYSPY